MRHHHIEDLIAQPSPDATGDIWLSICGTTVTKDSLQTASQLLSQVKRLELCCLQTMHTALYCSFQDFLAGLPHVRQLWLERIDWTNHIATSLVKHLKQCPIQELLITVCRFEEDADPLGILLPAFKSLEELAFFQNTLDQDHGISIGKVSEAISRATQLKELRVNNVFIKDQDMDILLKACAKLPLKSFDFSWDHDNLQKQHIDLLHPFHTLEALTLSYAMTKQLEDGTFCLSGNKDRDIMLADNTVESILQLLKNNSHLKVFELTGGSCSWPNSEDSVPAALDRMMSKLMQKKILTHMQRHNILCHK